MRATTGFLSMALALSLAMLYACAQAPPLRLGLGLWPPFELFFLARSRGLFAQAEIALELVEFTTPADSRRAFERGQIDGFAGPLDEVLLAWQTSERQPRIVYALSAYDDGSRETFDVLVWDQAVLAARGEDIKRLLAVFDSALAYSRTNPEQAYAVMARRERLSAAELTAWCRDRVRLLGARDQAPLFMAGGALAQSLRSTAETLLQQGRLRTLLPDTDRLLAPPAASGAAQAVL